MMSLTMSRIDSSRPPGVSSRKITMSALSALASSSAWLTHDALAGLIVRSSAKDSTSGRSCWARAGRTASASPSRSIARLATRRRIAPELSPTDYGLRTTDYGLRTTDYGLRTTDYGLRTTDYRLRTTDYGLRTFELDFPDHPRGGSDCDHSGGEIGRHYRVRADDRSRTDRHSACHGDVGAEPAVVP